MSQEAYLEAVLKRFGVQDCGPLEVPVSKIPERAKEGAPDTEYVSTVGSLLCAATTSRPDVTQAVDQLSRHLAATGPDHKEAPLEVVRYLKGTLSLGLTFGPDKRGGELVGRVDADWAGCKETRRSTSLPTPSSTGAQPPARPPSTRRQCPPRQRSLSSRRRRGQ